MPSSGLGLGGGIGTGLGGGMGGGGLGIGTSTGVFNSGAVGSELNTQLLPHEVIYHDIFCSR